MHSAVLAMIDSVCRSVCPSVTVRYHFKMTQATIMRSSLEDSSFFLVTVIEKLPILAAALRLVGPYAINPGENLY